MPDEQTPRDPEAFDVDAWEHAMRTQLRRLGCHNGREGLEEPDIVWLETLWDYLYRWNREEYASLQERGYADYWQRNAERPYGARGEHWLFTLAIMATPTSDVERAYALSAAGPVLAALQALPNRGGAPMLWAALADIPFLSESRSSPSAGV